MKAKELIKILQKDPDATVVVATSNFEQGNNDIEASGAYTFKGDLKEENFRDAFDGGRYTSTVVRRNDDGKKTFIKIS